MQGPNGHSQIWVFQKLKEDRARTGQMVIFQLDIREDDLHTRTVKVVDVNLREKILEGAEIVVAGGWAMRGAGGFEQIRKLAASPNAAVGGTRPASDGGWTTEEQVIGQNGQTIRPKLCLALGISGDVHHTVGMLESGVVAAINEKGIVQSFKWPT